VHAAHAFDFSDFKKINRGKTNYTAVGCPQQLLLLPLPSPLPPTLETSLISIQDIVTSIINITSVPGGSIRISYKGLPILSFSTGFADKANKRVVSENTLWRIGSVTKLFPATMLQIMEVGNVNVNLFAPSFKPINPFDDSNITFNQIASHQSGLQREAPFGVTTTDEVLDAVSKTYLVQPPGGKPSYSNLGFALLGHILGEKVAKSTFRELSSDLIFQPLEMSDTGFDYTVPGISNRLASGYDVFGNIVPFIDLGWVEPAGSAYSSLEDLSLLATALIDAAAAPNGTTVSSLNLGITPVSARSYLSPVYYNRDGQTLFGRPWEIQTISSSTNGDFLSYNKGGNLNGYSTLFSLVPDLSISIIAAFNGNVDEFAIGNTIVNALVDPLITVLTDIQPVLPFNPSQTPLDYVGIYTLDGTEVVVRFEQGMLLWYNSAVGIQVILDHFAGDIFRSAFPSSSFSCLEGELEALRYQYVIFQRNQTGLIFSTAMEGWIPGAIWIR